MYICQRCFRVVPPNTPQERVVVATCRVHHPKRTALLKSRKVEIIDRGGVGTQIVEELHCCPNCIAE